MTFKTILTTMITVLLTSILVTAEVPQVINYQGKLTASDGTLSDGAFLIKFIIYDAPTGGNELWNSGFQEITVTNGLFEVTLGNTLMPALPNNLFSVDTTRYLGIKISTDPEISPRIKLTSVAYAYQSLRSDSAGFATTADAAGYATNADLLDGLNSSDYASALHNHSNSDLSDAIGFSTSGFTDWYYYEQYGNDTNGTYVLDSVEITVPAAGYIEVTGSLGFIAFDHTTGTITEFWLQVNNTKIFTVYTPGTQIFRVGSDHVSTSNLATAFNSSDMFSVSTSGTHRFYLLLYYVSGTETYLYSRNIAIRAIYHPTVYGTTSKSTSTSNIEIPSTSTNPTYLDNDLKIDNSQSKKSTNQILLERLEALEKQIEQLKQKK